MTTSLRYFFVLCFLNITLYQATFAQARLVLNGASVKLSQGAMLVIDNGATNAITRNSGSIISEGENNLIKWNLGTTTGTYSIPFGTSPSNVLPVTFTKNAGSGAGYFLLSTYATGSQNSSQLPTGVTNFNRVSGADQSTYAADRFWKVSSAGYTTEPQVTNLLLDYGSNEFALPNITVLESGFVGQNWDANSSSWSFVETTTVNTSTNRVTIPVVTNAKSNPWWAVSYLADRHWVANSTTNAADSFWSRTAAGAPGAPFPTSYDDVFFNAANVGGITLVTDALVASINVASGYTGVINQGSFSITTVKDVVLNGGTFTGGTGAFNIGGKLIINGGVFNASAGITSITNNFTFNSGSFNATAGTFRFAGTSPQQIVGVKNPTFNNLTIDNTAGVSIETNTNLKGVLNVSSNSLLDVDGSSDNRIFTLSSSADQVTADAAIGILPAGARISGKITVERFMSIEGANNGRIYRYISAPVNNATVADLQQEIPVSGKFTGSSVCAGCSTNASLFGYTESVLTDINGSGVADLNDGYYAFPAASNGEIFDAGRGYTLYVRGNILSSAKWNLRGEVIQGNMSPVNFPVAYTSSGVNFNDGWNLVGNPFASTIDWSSSTGWVKTNLTNAIYMTDNGATLSRVSTWNGVVGTNGGTRYIATGQGFWVKATGAGTPVLQANENIKAAGTQTTFFRVEGPSDLLRITLSSGGQSDETVIHFRNDATDNFDDHADAIKFPNGFFNLSSLQEGTREALAINSLGRISCEKEIALSVQNTKPGAYQLTFSDLSSFDENVQIELVDAFAKTIFPVSSENAYVFNISNEKGSYGVDRFSVRFKKPLPPATFTLVASSVCENTNASVSVIGTQVGVNYALLQEGNRLMEMAGTGSTIQLNIPTTSVTPGENGFVVQAFYPTCTAQVVEKSFSLLVVAKPEAPVASPVTICSEGVASLLAQTTEGNTLQWFETAISTKVLSKDRVFAPVVSTSTTYFVSATNPAGCTSQRIPATVTVVKQKPAAISMINEELASNYATGNQWFWNGTPLNVNGAQTIPAKQPGKYTLQVDVMGCTTEASYDFVVTAVEDERSTETMVISAYPNPVVDYVTIDVPASWNSTNVLLLNGQSQVILESVITKQDEKSTASLDMRSLVPGLYFVKVVGVAGHTVKLLKQ